MAALVQVSKNSLKPKVRNWIPDVILNNFESKSESEEKGENDFDFQIW